MLASFFARRGEEGNIRLIHGHYGVQEHLSQVKMLLQKGSSTVQPLQFVVIGELLGDPSRRPLDEAQILVQDVPDGAIREFEPAADVLEANSPILFHKRPHILNNFVGSLGPLRVLMPLVCCILARLDIGNDPVDLAQAQGLVPMSGSAEFQDLEGPLAGTSKVDDKVMSMSHPDVWFFLERINKPSS